MDLITLATGAAPVVVLVITELLKLVPVAFTSKYPAWVNLIVSVIAALIVVHPAFTLDNIGLFLQTVLYIAVVAAVAYNQFTSKLFRTSSASVTAPPTTV